MVRGFTYHCWLSLLLLYACNGKIILKWKLINIFKSFGITCKIPFFLSHYIAYYEVTQRIIRIIFIIIVIISIIFVSFSGMLVFCSVLCPLVGKWFKQFDWMIIRNVECTKLGTHTYIFGQEVENLIRDHPKFLSIFTP